jgi:hypothetical protein
MLHSLQATRRYVPISIAVAILFSSHAAHADEGGVAFWLSGQYASLSAVPATPGWMVPVIGYYYSGDAGVGASFTSGAAIIAGLETSMSLVIAQPTFAPKATWWGGQASIGLGIGGGQNSTDADVSITVGVDTLLNRSDTVDGMTDLFPVATIAWARGNSNWMTYVTGDIPVGSYDSARLSNLGIGHAAIDLGGGYTYLNEKTGREFSAVAGFTYNWENSDTQYKNGVDSHLDWAASQFLSAHWEVGVAGYVYYQLSGDSGSGARLGEFKSRIASVGPELGYAFTLRGLSAYANLRGYWEFGAQDRVEGYAGFATLVIPLRG